MKTHLDISSRQLLALHIINDLLQISLRVELGLAASQHSRTMNSLSTLMRISSEMMSVSYLTRTEMCKSYLPTYTSQAWRVFHPMELLGMPMARAICLHKQYDVGIASLLPPNKYVRSMKKETDVEKYVDPRGPVSKLGMATDIIAYKSLIVLIRICSIPRLITQLVPQELAQILSPKN